MGKEKDVAKDKSYKNNFLSDVIFKIDYSIILDLQKNNPSDFQKALKEDFPILEPIQQFGFMMDVANEESSKNLNKIVWKFSSKDKNRFIEIDYQSLLIIFKDYKDYADFRSVVNKVINTFNKLYPDVVINRMGFRYINQIKLEEADIFDWSKYINTNLITGINFIEDKKQIKRTISSAELTLEDDTMLSMRWGIHNSLYPAVLSNKEFLLDYDCYTRLELESKDVINKLDIFNDIITIQFEKSITEKFRELLDKK